MEKVGCQSDLLLTRDRLVRDRAGKVDDRVEPTDVADPIVEPQSGLFADRIRRTERVDKGGESGADDRDVESMDLADDLLVALDERRADGELGRGGIGRGADVVDPLE